jgi:hypothetical protein
LYLYVNENNKYSYNTITFIDYTAIKRTVKNI